MATLAAQLFGGLVRARNRAYDNGRLGVARLPAPVVSVGNLSTGGSGKTPMVMALGEVLGAAGVRYDVLTRGYRRHDRKLQVAESGSEDVDLVGDEPLLLARRLRRPVLVHADRFRAGLEGERRFGSQLHLLDDGFQHRQLARSFDLVMLNPGDLDDCLLPAGRLRETPAALARASAVVVLAPSGSTPGPADHAALRARVAQYTAAPVYFARKRALSPALEPGARYAAFCGLARPQSFWQTLDELGVNVVARHAFRDHQRYGAGALRRLRQLARRHQATGYVTTKKDAIKLPRSFGRVTTVEIELDVEGLAVLITQLRKACGL